MQSLWMIVAALLFSLMGVAVKLASSQYQTWEIVMYRGTIGVCVMGAIIAIGARRSHASIRTALSTQRIGMHLTRGVSGTISLSLWFFSIAGLPIATAMTLNYSSPLFIGAWVAWTAHRAGASIEASMLAALLMGFVGVVLLLRPAVAGDQWMFAVMGTVSAALTAVAYLSVKALGQAGEPNGRIVFYFSAMNATAGLAGSLVFGFHRHDLRGIGLLACVGVCATLAQLAMTRAYASGGTLLTANLGFTGIIFASIWGIALFGDEIHPSSAVGMGIIVGASVLATWLTARTLRRTEAHPDETVRSS